MQRQRPSCLNILLLALLAGACTSTSTPSPPAVEESVPTVVEEDIPESTEDTTSSRSAIGDLPGRLVVQTNEGSIVVMGPDGSAPIELAPGGPGVHSQPTWSPDGASVAWTSLTADGPVVAVRNVGEAESTSTNLESPPFYLYWSPNGNSIAMLRPVPGSIRQDVLDVESGEIRPLGVGQPFYFVWEEAGDALLAAVNGESLIRIMIGEEIDYEGYQGGSALGDFQTPVVLGPGDIVVPIVRVDKAVLGRGAPGTLEPIVEVTGPVSMTLSPDQTRLAVLPFDGGTTPEPQLVAVGYQEQLLELPPGQVSIIDLATGSVETLPTRSVLTMNWSPDGSTVASLQAVADNKTVWSFSGEATESTAPFRPTPIVARTYLPFADQYNHSASWWSPDSQAFVWSESSDEGGRIWVDIIGDDAGAEIVADGMLAFWSPR